MLSRPQIHLSRSWAVSTVDVAKAKTNLSKLVKAVETGAEREIIITRDGRPAVRLIALGTDARPPLLGIAKGQFEVPETIDEDNEEIARLFNGED
ncbi:MAG TPA: type II toxin-antitoxin system prevent-host-death family antitoxin [Caulobacteraceae bacterium]|jgi:prevent-host-death family protein|nr:type II toxin-antitoxin system prevent-host-death family antitoxin [Caulobacteraceae bacterium]